MMSSNGKKSGKAGKEERVKLKFDFWLVENGNKSRCYNSPEEAEKPCLKRSKRTTE